MTKRARSADYDSFTPEEIGIRAKDVPVAMINMKACIQEYAKYLCAKYEAADKNNIDEELNENLKGAFNAFYGFDNSIRKYLVKYSYFQGGNFDTMVHRGTKVFEMERLPCWDMVDWCINSDNPTIPEDVVLEMIVDQMGCGSDDGYTYQDTVSIHSNEHHWIHLESMVPYNEM